jgi:23S rRNA U2552 (ribose-2'-O)-methylase RlmE/FtsJ
VVQVANQYQPHTVRFAICNEDEYVDELRSLNLADATEDVKVAAFANNMKFRMEPVDDFETEDLQTFLTSLTQGFHSLQSNSAGSGRRELT